MKPKLLQNGQLLPQLGSDLDAQYERVPLDAQDDPEAFLAQHGGDFERMVCSARAGASAALIAALPKLKMIAVFGVGYDAVALDAAAARGIVVSNTPDVLTDCVADLAVGAMIDLLRGISASDRFVRDGRWMHAAFALTTRVNGKRLGIVGFGRIGEAIARRAAGFDMTIRYHNRRARTDVGYEYAPSVIELARWCDVLVIAAAANPDAPPVIDAGVLAALGGDAYLVNIARGSLVDEAALVDALAARTIAGAALDVFVDEPQRPDRWLPFGDRVLLMPHIASATRETRGAMADLVLRNLLQFEQDGRALTPVP